MKLCSCICTHSVQPGREFVVLSEKDLFCFHVRTQNEVEKLREEVSLVEEFQCSTISYVNLQSGVSLRASTQESASPLCLEL